VSQSPSVFEELLCSFSGENWSFNCGFSFRSTIFLNDTGGISPSTSSPLTTQPGGHAGIGGGSGGGVNGVSGVGVGGRVQSADERLRELDKTAAVKAPASEVYGFVAYLASFVGFGKSGFYYFVHFLALFSFLVENC